MPANAFADICVGAAPDFSENLSDKSVGDEFWFAQTCRALFHHKAGTILHYITGFDERSCQRYASGCVKPPAYFLRRLLRHQDGLAWLRAIMDGCDAPWWQELQTAIELVERYRIMRR